MTCPELAEAVHEEAAVRLEEGEHPVPPVVMDIRWPTPLPLLLEVFVVPCDRGLQDEPEHPQQEGAAEVS